MAERVLKIKNYRNIGVEETQELLLNTSLAPGEMGSMVVVVGPNNCGKSNCLDALISFGSKDGLSGKDVPDFSNENPSPRLSVAIANDDITLGIDKILVDGKKSIEKYFYNDKKNNIMIESNLVSKPSQAAIDFGLSIVSYNVKNGHSSRLPEQYRQMAIDATNTRSLTDRYDIVEPVHKVNISVFGTAYWKNIGSHYTDQMVSGYIKEFDPTMYETPREIIEWETKNQMSVYPTIIRFAETVTANSQLLVTPDQVGNSPFFKALFSAIGFNVDELVNCYKKAREQNMFGLLKKTAKDINTRLLDVTAQFNRMFFLSDKKYIFELTLEKEAIYLSIFIDDIALHLDKQSAGFRWFFNFYFSVIMKNNLKRGDIIVMDEPATNLHMQGVQELRTFIKNYAKKYELTFVVSTHLPFFVDVNHLEEVRIVNRVGTGAIIESKFHVFGSGEETDALRPIKDALTISRYVLYDQGTTHTVFVEGVTDYCYLTAFKNLFKINNIVFLPIQGVKKPGIVDTLLKVEKLPTILVDGDFEGDSFKTKNQNKKNVEVISLTDIDPSWKNIEDLFGPEDKPKTKFFNDSVAFKNRLTASCVSKTTKDNFKKLLENIAV